MRETTRPATIACVLRDLSRRTMLTDGNPCTAGWRPLDYSQLLADEDQQGGKG